MNKHVEITASPSDQIDAAMLRLKCIIGTLRQLGGGTPWVSTDEHLQDALGVLGDDLKPIHDLLGDLYPLSTTPQAGPIERMHRDYQGRAALYDLVPSKAPGDTEADRVDWLSEPAERAQTAFPDTARDWAAKVLLMTLDGSTLEREGHLEALVDDARATLGIRETGEAK